MAEGEPTCADDYDDTYNGGCNSTPPIYQTWDMADKICGETGLYLVGGQTYRDTDWYKVPISLTQVEGVIWRVRGEFYQQNFIVADCAGVGMAPGDCNCDGSVNALDIDVFVGVLTGGSVTAPCEASCVGGYELRRFV